MRVSLLNVLCSSEKLDARWKQIVNATYWVMSFSKCLVTSFGAGVIGIGRKESKQTELCRTATNQKPKRTPGRREGETQSDFMILRLAPSLSSFYYSNCVITTSNIIRSIPFVLLLFHYLPLFFFQSWKIVII